MRTLNLIEEFLKAMAKLAHMFEHSEWFKPYVAGYYAYLRKLTHCKEWVLPNVEMILAMGMP